MTSKLYIAAFKTSITNITQISCSSTLFISFIKSQHYFIDIQYEVVRVTANLHMCYSQVNRYS